MGTKNGPQIFWGNVIRDARLKKNLTQKEVACLLHISRQCYSSYETGRLHPSPEIMTALSELYDYDFWGYAYRSLPYELVCEVHEFKAAKANEIFEEMEKEKPRVRKSDKGHKKS